MISMGTVWDRTTEFLSDNLGNILPIALFAIFVPAVISGNFAELRQGATPGLGLGLGVGSLVFALVTFWGQLAITALTLDPARGRGAMGEATRRFPAALVIMVLLLVAGLIATIPVGVILAAGGVDFAAMTPGTMPTVPPGAGTGVAIYLLILLPIALWVMARLAVVLPVLVGERLGIAAIPRAWRLTRGAALKIVGVIILYVVVSNVAGGAAKFGIGSIFKVLTGAAPGISIASVLTSVIVAGVATAFTVLGTVFTAKLFVALLVREEAARPQ